MEQNAAIKGPEPTDHQWRFKVKGIDRKTGNEVPAIMILAASKRKAAEAAASNGMMVTSVYAPAFRKTIALVVAVPLLVALIWLVIPPDRWEADNRETLLSCKAAADDVAGQVHFGEPSTNRRILLEATGKYEYILRQASDRSVKDPVLAAAIADSRDKYMSLMNERDRQDREDAQWLKDSDKRAEARDQEHRMRSMRYSAYVRIEKGMDHYDVSKLLDNYDFEETTKSGSLRVLVWHDGLKVVACTFDHDALISKTQSGLD